MHIFIKKELETQIIVSLLCLGLLLCLIVKGWVSAFLISSFFLTIVFYFQKNTDLVRKRAKLILQDKIFFLFILIPLITPFFVVLLTSLVKGNLELRDLDGPSRYLFSLIICIFLLSQRTLLNSRVIYSIALVPILTLVLINFVEKKAWSLSSRLTIYFIDPIIFGSICLTFSMLCLVIFLSRVESKKIKLLSLLGAISGVYLSIQSESRTGWAAIPIILFVIIYFTTKLNLLKTLVASIFIFFSVGFVLYQKSVIVHERTNAVVQDLKKYKWNQLNENTSAGERISYIRMGWYYMGLRPFTGWQGLDFLSHKDDPQIAKHASPEIRVGVKAGGFHNEFINNGVKFGFFGFLSSIFLVIFPSIFFLFHLFKSKENYCALIGLTCTLMYLFSCLTYQVLDFKFTASLYSILVILSVVGTYNHTKIDHNATICS